MDWKGFSENFRSLLFRARKTACKMRGKEGKAACLQGAEEERPLVLYRRFGDPFGVFSRFLCGGEPQFRFAGVQII